jgi:hypothetical protein
MKKIGDLIQNEVRRQQISVTDFAKMINCQRNNVYNIFERSTIYVDQLALISRKLKHNFFVDIVNDPTLIDIDSEEAIQEMENRRARSQFIEVVPEVLKQLNKQPIISFGQPLELGDVDDLPDFMLTDYFIAFTVGSFMAEKPQYKSSPFFEFQLFESNDGIKVYLMTNTFTGSRLIDVKIDYKTEEEWKKTLAFIFETFFNDHEQH